MGTVLDDGSILWYCANCGTENMIIGGEHPLASECEHCGNLHDVYVSDSKEVVVEEC